MYLQLETRLVILKLYNDELRVQKNHRLCLDAQSSGTHDINEKKCLVRA